MAKRYIADNFEVSGGVGANVLLDDGTTVALPISFDSTSSTRLANTSGTNMGDQTTIAGITGTKAQFDTSVTDGDFLFVGDANLYVHPNHSGEVTSVADGAQTIASDVVDLDNLAVDLKSRVVVAAADIDWNLGVEFTRTLTAAITLTDSNLPTGTDTKCIVLHITGEFAITPPAYWVNKGGTYDGTVSNMFVIDCLNGTGASEIVNYIIIPDA
jgi:hypothetical protein